MSDKDRKPFATDLKTIYHAATEEKALEALERVTDKWSEKRISQRHRPAEVLVSGDLQGHEEMDYAIRN